MAFKFFATFALIAVASAGIIPVQHEIHEIPSEHQHHYQQHATPVVYQHAAPALHTTHIAAAPQQQQQQQHVYLQKQHHEHEYHHHEEQYPDDPHPQYNFAYDVKDTVSGDSKSQSESRDGDVVHGEYSLDDADGFRRIVKYTADDINGFNAVVHREPLTHKVVAAPAPVHHYHHSPNTAVVKAPVAYAAVAPTYSAALPAHHEHHHQDASSYTSYEVPQQYVQAPHEIYHH